MAPVVPRLPVTVYSQQAGKLFNAVSDTPDHQWIMVTMDDGTTITAGSGWILPLGYPDVAPDNLNLFHIVGQGMTVGDNFPLLVNLETVQTADQRRFA